MPPQTHEHEPNWPPQEVLCKDTLLTWEASNAGQETKTPLRKGELEVSALPQECTNKGNCKPSWPSQETSHKAIPSTWEGVALWDPGGRPPRERTLNLKGPVEATDIAVGIDAPQQKCRTRHRRPQENPWLYRSGVSLPVPPQGANHALYPYSITPSSRYQEVHPLSFRGPYRGHGVVLGNPEQRQHNKDKATRPFGGRHTRVTHHHTCPHAMHALVHRQRESSMRSHSCSIKSLHAPISVRRHFAAVRRLSVK